MRRIRLIVSRVGPRTSASERDELTRLAVFDACKRCCERWGLAKVSVDDVATEARVSRATLYRMFPGGRDALLEAYRRHETAEFFDRLGSEIDTVDSFEDLLIAVVVQATRDLRDDQHLAVMLASEPGSTIESLTVEGLPQIITTATSFLAPLAEQYVDPATARAAIDLLSRLTLSYFLAPSDGVDLGDEASARRFLSPFLTAFVSPPTPV